MSALASCQICGSRDQQTYVERAPVRYVRCRQCGLITNADAEALLAEAEEHYAEETYFGVYSRRFGQKLRSARRRIDLLRSYQPTGRLLDIGCGLGDTLIAAREAGYDASGLDIGAYPVQHCQELGFEVRQASVTDTGLAAESFDLVTMWDVLEHIPRTADGLREVARVLKPGGVLGLIVPSGGYLRACLFRNTYQNYRGLWARTHFVYHNSRTLSRVLVSCGLQPLPFPLVHRGALCHGPAEATVELVASVPRYLLSSFRRACRLSRNLLVIARKTA